METKVNNTVPSPILPYFLLRHHFIRNKAPPKIRRMIKVEGSGMVLWGSPAGIELFPGNAMEQRVWNWEILPE
jgi:hypothetical protein